GGSPGGARLAGGCVGAPAGPCEPGERCLVPGVSDRRQACAGEWLVERASPTLDAHGLPSRRQRCRDGDPGCDRDGAADGACTMEVALCTNVFDLRVPGKDGLPRCHTSSVRRARLLPPRGGGSPRSRADVMRSLRAALRALPDAPASLDRACTATVGVAVPAAGRGPPGQLGLRPPRRRPRGTR